MLSFSAKATRKQGPPASSPEALVRLGSKFGCCSGPNQHSAVPTWHKVRILQTTAKVRGMRIEERKHANGTMLGRTKLHVSNGQTNTALF